MMQPLPRPRTPQDELLAFLGGGGDNSDDTNSRADAIIADGRARSAAPAPTPQQAAPSDQLARPDPSAFAGPVAPSSPEDAIGTFLRGGGPPAQGMSNTNDPLESAQLADARRSELQDRLDRGDFQNGRTARTLDTVKGEMASDPFTGDAPHAQVAANQTELNKASLANQSPMIDQQHHAEQFKMDQLLEPQKLKNVGDLAVAHEQGQTARDVASTRADAMQGVAETKAWGNGVKLTNDETNVMDKLHQTQMEGPQLLQMLEQADPGIATNTSKYKSWTDFLGAKAGGYLYRSGAPIDHSKIDQVTGFLGEIIPRMVVNSVRSKELLNDLKLHAPQVGLSDGENYERLSYILHSIIPHTQQAIEQTHMYGAGNAPQAVYDPNDPNTWKRVQ